MRSIILMVLAFLCGALPARADYQVQLNGAVASTKAFTCGTAFGTGICPGYVPMDLTGAAFGVNGNPIYVVTPQLTPSAPSGALTLATGGSAQQLFSAGEVVHNCVIQNPPNATEAISVNFYTTATAAASGGTTSVLVGVGSVVSCGGLTTAVSWTATTTGHAINAWKY